MGYKTAWTLLLVTAAIALPAGALAQTNMTGSLGGLPTPVAPACGIGAIDVVNDFHSSSTAAARHKQDVAVKDNNVLLAIALRNNGAGDVAFNKIRDATVTDSATMSASQTANLDREDVFSALALGVHDGGGPLEALACVSDRTTAATQTTTASQSVNLDENTVLLAIALHNSGGSPLNLDDVESIDQQASTTQSHDQDVTVPRENAFLSLALGAGGSG